MTVAEHYPTQIAFESLPDAAMLLSPDLRVQLANHKAVSLFGLHPGDRLHGLRGEWVLRVLMDISGRRGDRHGHPSAEAVRFVTGGEEHYFVPDAVVTQNDARRVIAITLVLREVTALQPLDMRRDSPTTEQEDPYS